MHDLAYLEERESIEPTPELLRIPGFEEEFEKARREVAEGRVTPLEDLEPDD